MTCWQHHSIGGSQGLHMDCGSSSKCAGIDTMNSTKSIKQQMLRVRSKPRASFLRNTNLTLNTPHKIKILMCSICWFLISFRFFSVRSMWRSMQQQQQQPGKDVVCLLYTIDLSSECFILYLRSLV